MRTWKVALSLAVVAAIAVPAFAGTWRLEPWRWVELTVGEKQRLSNFVERDDGCTLEWAGCTSAREILSDGGVWYPAEQVTSRYLARNFYVSAGAFILVFGLAMVGLGMWRGLGDNAPATQSLRARIKHIITALERRPAPS
jgi:hypothetical protein